MAARARQRVVKLSAAALDTLSDIWLWNATHYGSAHADGYVRFLEAAFETLTWAETVGRPVPDRPEYRYLLIKRRAGGHGHVAVFQVDGEQVTVLRIFHTAQDWAATLKK